MEFTKKEQLEGLWIDHKAFNTGAWKYPERPGVAGYLGTGPVAIVGFQPSGDLDFISPQAIWFYEQLSQRGLGNAHIMDALSSELGVDPEREKAFFLAQLRVIDPTVILVMDMTRSSRWNGALPWVRKFLERDSTPRRVERIYHYTNVRRSGDWPLRWGLRLDEVVSKLPLDLTRDCMQARTLR
jgi:hypothetical protein